VTSPFRNASVLVTGAGGFIGSHLVHRLVQEGATVHALTSRVSSVYPARLADLHGSITLEDGNLTDGARLSAIAARAKPRFVFHLGAYAHSGTSWERVDECIQTNVQGTVNLLHAVAACDYERLVFVGTGEIYAEGELPFREDAPVRPTSPYAVSKLAAEHYCRVLCEGRSWPIVMARPFNNYGPAQSPDRIIPEVIVGALRGRDIMLTQGLQTREFNFVSDTVDGLLRAATTAGAEGEVFNFGCGEEISVRAVASLILELMGDPVRACFGALPDRPGQLPRMVADSTKARDWLGWSPKVGLREGLSRTIEWYRRELADPASPFER
jgi:nucleoside-diphosphate-sugar epimerase